MSNRPVHRPVYRTVVADTAQVAEDMHVLRPLPSRGLRQIGPFIFLDHFGPRKLAEGDKVEVPPHPHAGFQTVTYLLAGRGFHKDSSGAAQWLGPGGVNWMTAGRGIVHLEEIEAEADGVIEGFQIWVNLPARDKYLQPGFQAFEAAVLPVVPVEGGEVRIIAGRFGDHSSPVTSYSPLFLYHLRLDAGAVIEVPVDAAAEAGVYVVRGGVLAGETPAGRSELLVYAAGEGALHLQATEASELLVLGGTPLREPMASYGPFVMNSMDEIQQVIEAYQTGKMGRL
ncbi:MAG: pirin family protein [Bacteroidia bacterium]